VNRRLRVAFSPDSEVARIESVPARGANSFLLVSARESFLMLDDKTRVVRSPRLPLILAEVVGLPLGPAQLRRLLRGCYLLEPAAALVSYNDQWVSIPGDRNGRVFFHRTSPSDPWQMMTLFYPGGGLEPAWRMDYLDFREGLPHLLVVTGIGIRIHLEIQLSNILPASLPMSLFEETIPSTSRRITADEIDLSKFLAP
jgi:hypothetical protein